jgi:hypothetical protein
VINIIPATSESGGRPVGPKDWDDVVTDFDVLVAIFEQAGLTMDHGPDEEFSVQSEGHAIHFEFDRGRLRKIRVASRGGPV